MTTTTGMIVSQGVTALLSAWQSGSPLQLGVVKISPDTTPIVGTETDLADAVYTVPSGMVSMQLDTNSLVVTLSLTPSVGTFVIGKVGIFSTSGELFALALFPGAGTKIATAPPAVVGNTRTLQVVLLYDNLAANISSIVGGLLLDGADVLTALESVVGLLPTTQPSTPNTIWNFGGVLCVTPSTPP